MHSRDLVGWFWKPKGGGGGVIFSDMHFENLWWQSCCDSRMHKQFVRGDGIFRIRMFALHRLPGRFKVSAEVMQHKT